MRVALRRFATLSAAMLCAVRAQSQATPPVPLAPLAPEARATRLVDAAWLAQHLHDDNLVLLHVGDPTQYPDGHIEGARAVATADVAVSDASATGLILEMPSADTLRARLQALGVSSNSRVVIYWGKDWVSPATRILLTFVYAGLGDQVALLDGGMPAWVEAGHPTTKAVPPPRSGVLGPLTLRNFIVTADYVNAHRATPGFAVVDARDTAFFAGSRTGGSPSGPHRTGHIAGAKSVPFGTLVDAKNRVQSIATLSDAFAKAGVGKNDTVIGYCHIGQQATAMLTAAWLSGHSILLYDGSFQDWSRRAELPVETGWAGRLP